MKYFLGVIVEGFLVRPVAIRPDGCGQATFRNVTIGALDSATDCKNQANIYGVGWIVHLSVAFNRRSLQLPDRDKHLWKNVLSQSILPLPIR